MRAPDPTPGLVVRYSFLWWSEHRAGREEGVKDRPCAVVLVSLDEDGLKQVTVLPITHSPPGDPDAALELPAETKQRLGLDGLRSWIVLDEVNRFIWPGPDLVPRVRGDMSTVAYGHLPRALMLELRRRIGVLAKARRLRTVRRTE